MNKTRRLTVELLEDRLTPSGVWGQAWPDPGHLTLSFAPDGTDAGGSPSNLYRLLNAQSASPTWQATILKAFQTWAINSNLNIGLVSDGGQPLGSAGAVQGDSHFGDIRIAARPLAPTSVSTASPFSWSGTTWSGDVLFNNLQSIGSNGSGQYDLFTLALHEAGHSLGLGDLSTDQHSVLYQTYLGPRTALAAQDIAALQAIYGPRQQDQYSLLYGNHSFGSAMPLGNDPSQLALEADITTIGEAEYFKVTTPNMLLLNGMQVKVNAGGLSLLEPTVSVFDASQRLVGTAAASSPLNNNLTINLNGVQPNKTYYIKVSNATSSVFGVGSYQLSVSYSNLLTGLVDNVLLPVVHILGNTVSSIVDALVLPAAFNASTPDQRFDYLWRAGLVSPTETDYYQIQTPAGASGTTFVMNSIAWAMPLGDLDPVLHVFNAQGDPVPVQILGNSDGLYSAQVTGMAPSSKYYIEVAAFDPSSTHSVGEYVLGIKFDASGSPVALTPLDSNRLSSAAAVVVSSLVVKQNGLFHLALGANDGSSSSSSVVTLTVTDQNGKVVLSISAADGRPPSTGVAYLTAGTYTVRVSVTSSKGTYLPVNYWLAGEMLSDPMGPYQANPTNTSTSSSGSGGGYTYGGSSTTSTSTASSPTYY